jgi:hypothetical protein
MSIIRFAVALGILAVAGTAAAAAHPAYKPTRVEGVSTYKGKNQVGNWLFTMEFVEPSVKALPAGLGALRFPKGNPPKEWWGRSYFPCTIKEASATISEEYRKALLATEVWIDGKNVTRSVTPIRTEHLGPTWNTVSFEGATINGLLKALGPGKHELVLWRQLEFEVRDGNSWKAGAISLAKGKLPIEVK